LLELPPRARRIPNPKECPMPRLGTTSACAENTVTIRVEGFQHGNYLRVRGEYIVPHRSTTISWELPPRARRIPRTTRKPSTCMGTTSACAENT